MRQPRLCPTRTVSQSGARPALRLAISRSRASVVHPTVSRAGAKPTLRPCLPSSEEAAMSAPVSPHQAGHHSPVCSHRIRPSGLLFARVQSRIHRLRQRQKSTGTKQAAEAQPGPPGARARQVGRMREVRRQRAQACAGSNEPQHCPHVHSVSCHKLDNKNSLWERSDAVDPSRRVVELAGPEAPHPKRP